MIVLSMLAGAFLFAFGVAYGRAFERDSQRVAIRVGTTVRDLLQAKAAGDLAAVRDEFRGRS